MLRSNITALRSLVTHVNPRPWDYLLRARLAQVSELEITAYCFKEGTMRMIPLVSLKLFIALNKTLLLVWHQLVALHTTASLYEHYSVCIKPAPMLSLSSEHREVYFLLSRTKRSCG